MDAPCADDVGTDTSKFPDDAVKIQARCRHGPGKVKMESGGRCPSRTDDHCLGNIVLCHPRSERGFVRQTRVTIDNRKIALAASDPIISSDSVVVRTEGDGGVYRRRIDGVGAVLRERVFGVREHGEYGESACDCVLCGRTKGSDVCLDW